MKNKIISFFTLLAMAGAVTVACTKDKPVASAEAPAPVKGEGALYTVDTLNSRVEWKAYKIVKSDNTGHLGTVKFESGDITVKDGHLESGKFVADMSSLTSVDLKDNKDMLAKLVTHLKSPDFFDIAKFPTASFEITKVSESKQGDYNTEIAGNLTIKGITKPATFKANVLVKDGVVSIATEPTDLNRQDFGVKFQMPVADGLIKDELTLQILVKALEKK